MKFRKLIVQSIIWRSLYFFTVLLLNILLSRYFRATGTGFIYYISNYFSFILLLGSACLETGMAYYGSQGTISYQKLSVFSLAWSALICTVIYIFLSMSYHEPASLVSKEQFMYFSFTYITGILLTTYFCALFYSKQDFHTPNLILTITNIFLLLLLPFSNWFGSHDFIAKHFLNYYFFNFLLQGVLICCAFLYKNKQGSPFVLPHAGELSRLFSYSLYALSANIIFFLLYRIDYWFINNTCKVCMEGDLGNYIQVSKLGQLFFILPGIIASAVFPRTASGKKEEVYGTLEIITKGIFLFTGLICLVLVFTGRFLFPFVFGSTFTKMYVPFVLLIPGILSVAALHPLSAYYSGKNMLHVNLQGSALALLLIAAGDAVFIPRYGIRAAALVSTAGYVLYYAYMLLSFRKEYHTSIRGFFYPKQADFLLIKKWVTEKLKMDRRK